MAVQQWSVAWIEGLAHIQVQQSHNDRPLCLKPEPQLRLCSRPSPKRRASAPALFIHTHTHTSTG